MLTVILNRLLIELEEVKKEYEVKGTNIKIAIEYGADRKRHEASVTEGKVVSIGPDAYKDWGYDSQHKKMSILDKIVNFVIGLVGYRIRQPNLIPVKLGDRVQVAKFSPRPVFDPDEPDKRYALINDEDVLAIITKENTNE